VNDPAELSAGDLTDAQRAAIVEAVQAVVRRDLDAVRSLSYPPWRKHADKFWTWADYRGRSDLVMPPGEIEDWGLYILELKDGLAVLVEMWAEGVGRTELELNMELYTNEDGSVRTELRDMRPM
jgi:hypothetical protein